MLDDDPQRVGVLVIRVWVEPAGDELVVRISGRSDLLSDDETSVTVAGRGAAMRVVDEWLVAFERGQSVPARRS